MISTGFESRLPLLLNDARLQTGLRIPVVDGREARNRHWRGQTPGKSRTRANGRFCSSRIEVMREPAAQNPEHPRMTLACWSKVLDAPWRGIGDRGSHLYGVVASNAAAGSQVEITTEASTTSARTRPTHSILATWPRWRQAATSSPWRGRWVSAGWLRRQRRARPRCA
jgi:hypothetical protein